MDNQTEWEWEITPAQHWFRLHLKELVQYKDLLLRFVRRDILASYQQTILGPLWVFLQPLLTSVVYWIIFHRIVNISTGSVPALLFFFPGTLIWGFFSDCFTSTMNTFQYNAHLFTKVYFPRLIVPLSSILFHAFRLCIQLLLFGVVYLIFYFTHQGVHPNWAALLLPLLIVMTGCFALGLGLIISVFTAKYRDLDNITQFLLRMFMFLSPVVYPAALVSAKFRLLFWLNPLTAVIETFRQGFFSAGQIPWNYFALSLVSSLVILFTGVTLFNKKAAEIMDII